MGGPRRLHEARHYTWVLWAAAQGALYPWHGLSQVLDHDPGYLPPGIESTVAGLDAADLYRAARASTEVLAAASAAAARRHPADLPAAMAAYVTRVLSETTAGRAPLAAAVSGLPCHGAMLPVVTTRCLRPA